jgi:hypothetical protein
MCGLFSMVFTTNIINDFQSLQKILFFAARCHNLLHKNENQFEIKHFDLDLITKINYNINRNSGAKLSNNERPFRKNHSEYYYTSIQ